MEEIEELNRAIACRVRVVLEAYEQLRVPLVRANERALRLMEALPGYKAATAAPS
jgi:hypothetical protein